MIDPRARRAHAIFVAALALDPPRRAEYLADACGTDKAVRSEVDRLLAAAETSAGFLESPALARPGASPPGPPEVRGYRLVRILGVGGMATVYEAEQHHPRRHVALKVMHFSLARTSALERFRFETEVLARLKHPGIAQIHEAGTCEQPGGQPVPFFAMEYVEDARTITAHAATVGLPLRARLAMFAEVCDAVQYGHQVGVIHRDLKPGNILVDRSGRTRIIDFGIARSLEPDAGHITRHEGDGQLIGTLNYMSPEQCSGGHRVDTRTDVYALGVILYELVTGRLPHDLSQAAVSEAVRIIQSIEPPRPGAIAPAARGDLEAIIVKAMDKDPRRRYDGAGSLATDIRRFLDSKTVEARLPSPWHHARLFARRHKALFYAAAVTALTILIASGLTAWFAYRSWHDLLGRREAERAAIIERDAARRQAYSASISSAFLSYQAGEAARGRERLDLAPANLRGWEWDLISALLESNETVIRAHDDMVFAMDANPVHRRLATACRDGSLAVWNLDSGAEVGRAAGSTSTPALAVALSHDGRSVFAGFGGGALKEWTPATGGDLRVIGSHAADLVSLDTAPSGLLAAASDDGIAKIWDPVSASVVHTFDDQAGGIHRVRFSADGARLMTWNYSGSVCLRDADDWSPVLRLELGGRADAGAISADGAVIATGGAEGRIRVWDAASGALLMDAGASPNITTVISLAFSADGRTLYAGKIDRSISAWPISPDSQPRVLGRHDEAVSALFVDEQTDRLISASRDRTVRFWPLDESQTPAPMTRLQAHDQNILSVAFSPDGGLLATAGRDHAIHLWEPALGLRLATLKGHSGDIYAIRFSPDGRRLASASADGSVRLWSTLTGECQAVLGPPRGLLWSVAFSPDGARLAVAGDEGVITIWTLASGNQDSPADPVTIAAHPSRINSIAFDPDGAAIACCCRDGTVTLWNAQTGSMLRTLPGHTSDVFACVFSPDGLRLFTGSRDQSVRVWDPSTGESIATLDCRGQFITSLAIDAAGERLAAGSWFAEVIVWDLRTFDRVFSFKANSAAIRSLAFSPGAPVLVCGGHDGVATFWSGLSGGERRGAREQSLSQLAAAERLLAQSPAEAQASSPGPSWLAEDPATDSDLLPWVRKATLRREASRRPPN